MSYKSEPDEIKICPYDKSHRILAYRFQTHLIRCAKSHPELAKQYEVCPFNATHRFLGADRNAHLLECPDNNLVEQTMRKFKGEREPRCQVPEIVSTVNKYANDDEDWDTEEPQVTMKLSALNNSNKEPSALSKSSQSSSFYERNSSSSSCLPEKRKHMEERDEEYTRKPCKPKLAEESKDKEHVAKTKPVLEQETNVAKPKFVSLGRGLTRKNY